MSLSSEEKKLLSQSWEVVDNNRIECGTWFFLRLFESLPPVQDLFPAFKGASVDELRISKKLRAHALQFLSLFANYIDVIDEPEVLETLLLNTGRRHHAHGVDFEYFEKVVPSFLDMLVHFNGAAEFTAAHQKVWEKTVAAMWPTIKTGIDQAAANNAA